MNDDAWRDQGGRYSVETELAAVSAFSEASSSSNRDTRRGFAEMN